VMNRMREYAVLITGHLLYPKCGVNGTPFADALSVQAQTDFSETRTHTLQETSHAR
jgi:hypothetical protein